MLRNDLYTTLYKVCLFNHDQILNHLHFPITIIHRLVIYIYSPHKNVEGIFS